ncbi:MAG TPA: Crp/Fnr family transcriptional regulator [Caproiciproducens sp.]|nr:Crp/Fnr family transcriptional regulator [Caproiciproducens sp.]
MQVIRKQNKYRVLLSRSFLFNNIDEQSVGLAFLSDECNCLEFEPGEKIYTQNHYKKSIGLVVSGKLKACKPGADNGGLILNTFLTGGVFGVAGLFNNQQQYVSEIIAIKRSRVLFLSQTLLHRLFEQNYRIAENYIGYLANRICFLNGRIDSFTGGSAEHRLANFLDTLSAQSDDPGRFSLPCTLTQLAGTLDLGRASLYRALETLVKADVIRRDGRIISVVDRDRLRSFRFR